MFKFIISLLILFSVIRSSEQIVNGNKTGIENYPWTVAINTGAHWHWWVWGTCTGTIISTKWVITAAHCNENHWWPMYQFIRARSNVSESEGSVVNIEKWITHPRYNEETYALDLALIELKEELVLSDELQPIKMLDTNFNITEDLVVRTAGFGDTCDDCKNQQLFELIETTCIPITKITEETNEIKKFDVGAEETVMYSIDKNFKATGIFLIV